MIEREIKKELVQLVLEYPVVAILGPRQAGKTTLAKMLPEYEYSNLEIPTNRNFATNDPIAFLKQFKGKVILDEIQRIPTLLSYIQGIVDETQINGQFIITGSHQLELRASMTQSLAGRIGILTLLPLTINELQQAGYINKSFEEYIFNGFLPRVYDQNQRPQRAYSNYYQTYVERDVRQLVNLQNSSIFEKFLKLLAGRVGQTIDLGSLGNDVGVDGKTIKKWLSILEASYIIYKLPPYFENFGKRLIKSPKYYFVEPGLLISLLGINSVEQITRDPLVGSVFENLVVMECVKHLYNKGKRAELYFYRDSNQNEIDLIYSQNRTLEVIEIKSSSTFHSSYFNVIDRLIKASIPIRTSNLIYNGDEMELSNNKFVHNFKNLYSIFNYY